MSLWAIDYALDVNAMKEAAYSRGDAERFCAAVEACFAERHFAKLDRLGLHVSSRDDALSDAYLTCLDLSAIADSDKFIRRLSLLRINDVNDLLPVLFAVKASFGSHPICEGIDGYADNVESPAPAEEITIASTLKAFIQDIFLDEPGPNEKKPESSPRKPSPEEQ